MGQTSGRINTIAISPADPQLILVGGATGGIWRSTDGGDNFVPVSDDQIDLAVGSIAFAPSDPSIVYAGMGDVTGGYMGTGVLKSVDSGQTWKPISNESLPAPGTISKVLVEPSDASRVYLTQYAYRASTGQGEVYASGFFVSSDGGKTWIKTLTGLPRDMVHHPTNPGTLYVSMATTFSEQPPSAGLYKSTDGGRTWSPLFVPAYQSATDIRIAIAPSEPDTMYVFTGLLTESEVDVSIHTTRDAGSTWSNIGLSGIDIGGFGYNSFIAVDPIDAKTVYVGTHDLYKSKDGCLTWVNLTKNWHESSDGYDFAPTEATTHSDQHAIAFSESTPRSIFIGNDGGLSVSVDGGETFRSNNASLTLTQFNSITLNPADVTKSCGGTQDNGALIRNSTQTRWMEFFAGDSGKCLIDPANSGVFYVSYIFGGLFRVSNHGTSPASIIATETTFSEPLRYPRIAFYAPFDINSVSGALYFGTSRVYISTNRGNDWTPLGIDRDLTEGTTPFGADVLTAIGITPADSNAVYSGSAQGRVMVTKNGINWLERKRGLPRRFVTSLVIDRENANKAYVTFSGFGSGHIFKTVNGGVDWTDISKKLPNIPVNALLIDPLDAITLYAGTDVGVFRSTDDGANWSRFNDGLPPAIITGFSSRLSGEIQVATYGRGAYELTR